MEVEDAMLEYGREDDFVAGKLTKYGISVSSIDSSIVTHL